MLGFSFFYVSSLYFLKKAKIKLSVFNLLPFVWLASFGYTYAQLFLNPIWRGFELGVSFLTFMLVAMYYYGDIKPLRSFGAKFLTILACLAMGVLIYSDPYYTYFTIGPILIFSVFLLGRHKITTKQFSLVAVLAVASLGISKMVAFFGSLAGIKMAASFPHEFVAFTNLPNNILVAIHNLLMIFGADFFGQAVMSLVAISALCNFAILCFIGYRTYTQSTYKITQLSQYWKLFFVFSALGVFATYTVSTMPHIQAYRYLILVVLFAVLLLSFALGTLKSRKLLVGFVIVTATVLNVSLTVRSNEGFLQAGSLGNHGNAVNYALINTIRDKNLTKGYAHYWQSSINSYLSQGTIDFLPVTCPGGITQQFHWLTNPARFEISATRSFYIIDDDFTGVDSCTYDQITEQFGQPEEVLTVTNKKILIYNYDLQPKTQN